MAITINNTGGYPEYVYTRYKPNIAKSVDRYIDNLEYALIDFDQIVKELKSKSSINKFVNAYMNLMQTELEIPGFGERLALIMPEVDISEIPRIGTKITFTIALSKYNSKQYSEIHKCWKKACPWIYQNDFLLEKILSQAKIEGL